MKLLTSFRGPRRRQILLPGTFLALSKWTLKTSLWRVPSPRQRVADYLPLPLPFTKSADGKERDVQTKNACGWGTNQPTTSPVAYHSPRVSVIALGLPSRFRCACSGANEMWRQNQQYTPQNQLLWMTPLPNPLCVELTYSCSCSYSYSHSYPTPPRSSQRLGSSCETTRIRVDVGLAFETS